METQNRTKCCRACREDLPVAAFSRDNGSKDGLQSYCKKCAAQYRRNRLANNFAFRESKRRRNVLWRQKHPNYRKEYYAERGAMFRELARAHYANNPERALAKRAILRLIRSGKIPRAKELQCVTCGEPACDYHHHRGYAPEHCCNVVPLCRTCHRRCHSKYNGN